VEDIDMASIKAGYHAVAVQLHERTGKDQSIARGDEEALLVKLMQFDQLVGNR
jgi:hypothetical protein